MKQFCLLLTCLCCFSAVLTAQSTQKLIGDRQDMQQFLEDQLIDHPAFPKLLEITTDRPEGQWELVKEGNTQKFRLDGQLVFQLDISQDDADLQYPAKNLPVFKGEAVPLTAKAMDETFFNYQVFSIDNQAIRDLAKAKTNQKLNFRLQLGEQDWLLQLEPNDLLEPGLQIKVLTEQGIRYEPMPNHLYKGYVGAKEKQLARFTIADDYLIGALQIGKEEYFLEPVPQEVMTGRSDLYMLYRASDVRPDPTLSCGVTEAKSRVNKPTKPHDHDHAKMPDPGCFDVTELALAAAFDMVTKFGTVSAAAAHIVDITALMEVLYDPFQLDYRIVDIVIPGSAAADPWSTSAFMDVLLPDFATWGNTGSNFDPHDIGQLWVARDVFRGSVAMPDFSLIGRADGIGVVCTADRYNVCEDWSANMNCLRSLSAHEIGHLWDGIHGDATAGVTIMSANIVCGATAFTAANTTNIQNHIDSRACLEEDCCRLVVDCSNITDENLDCRSDLPPVDFDLPIITESCGNVILSALTIIPGNSGCPGDEVTIERTYFMQDDEGNLFRCYQQFTVESTQGPSITCPTTQKIDLDANCMATLPNYTGSVFASAECSNFSISVAQTSPAPGTAYNAEADVSVLMTATDGCGRQNTCSFNVEIVDNSPPMITQCDGGTLVFDGEDNFLSSDAITLVADDNCGIADISYDPEFIDCEQLGENVNVDITVTDINGNTSMCSANVFVDGLPCGWMQSYIGCTGDISYDVPTETFVLTSNNCYYANPFTSDQLTFAKYELCGNGEIIAEVSSVMTQGWGGVTMRETLDPGSKKIQLMNNGSYLVRREARYTTNGPAFPQQLLGFGKKWVRLVRNGNQFAGYISPNGINWQFVMAVNLPMPNCIYIGLVTTNFNPFIPVTATFNNVFVDPPYMGMSPLMGNPNVLHVDPNADQINEYAVEVYPNPSDGNVTVDLANFNDSDVHLSLYNSNGGIEWQRDLGEIDQLREELNLGDLPIGVYWLRVQPADAPATMRKIVITKH